MDFWLLRITGTWTLSFIINVVEKVKLHYTRKNEISNYNYRKNRIKYINSFIFNYFRAYFSFESDDEDSYGMIENNKENQEFSNYFRKLKPEEYELVAKSVLDYIIMMGGFGKR